MQQARATVQFKKSMGAIQGVFGTAVACISVPCNSSSHLQQPCGFSVFFAVKKLSGKQLIPECKIDLEWRLWPLTGGLLHAILRRRKGGT
jgi:hypothetical protein